VDSWVTVDATTSHLGEKGQKENINTISELFDHETGCWNIDMVRRIFIVTEADAILIFL
jgi:hypothetical protein